MRESWYTPGKPVFLTRSLNGVLSASITNVTWCLPSNPELPGGGYGDLSALMYPVRVRAPETAQLSPGQSPGGQEKPGQPQEVLCSSSTGF